MRKLAVAISTGALVLFGLTFEAGAQTLNDLPTAGPAICEGMAGAIEQGKAQGTPFAELAAAGEENIYTPACVTGQPPGGDGGGDTENPLCGPLLELIGQFEANGAPPELTGPFRQALEALGCTTTTSSSTTTTAPSTTTTQAPSTTTTAQVLGETQTSGQTGGTALPATGGGLLGAASAGISFLALSSIIRRFFR